MKDSLINLKQLLINKNLEEKIEIVANILCDEWYTNDDYEYIEGVLAVFYQSYLKEWEGKNELRRN